MDWGRGRWRNQGNPPSKSEGKVKGPFCLVFWFAKNFLFEKKGDLSFTEPSKKVFNSTLF